MRPEYDDNDAAIVARRRYALDQFKGPRVGDWVRLANGEMRRFTYEWPDGLQTTVCDGESGSFYLGHGWVSYSGSLDSTIPRDKLRDTGATRSGRVWIFHHDFPMAHNGVTVEIEFRVFEVTP